MKLFYEKNQNLVGLDVFYLKIDDFRSNPDRFSEKNDVPEGIKHVGNTINDLSDSINDIQNILRDQKKVKFGVIYPINDLRDINDGVFLVKKMKLFYENNQKLVGLDVSYLNIDDFRSDSDRFSEKTMFQRVLSMSGTPLMTTQTSTMGSRTPIMRFRPPLIVSIISDTISQT